MKKTYLSFISLLSIFSLVACGRPSTSRFFALDGVGDPDAPIPGNPLPGKWGGSISLANWQLLPPSYDSILTDQVPIDTFVLSQAYLNATDMAGLGGWDLLTITIPQPRRLALGEMSKCYMDPIALPLLGGPLESTDVGEDIEFDFGDTNFDISRDDDDDIAPDDLFVWLTGDFQDPETGDFLAYPHDVDVDMEWEGGTLGNLGYDTAPPLGRTEVLHFPEDIVHTTTTAGMPSVNNDRLSADMIPLDSEYEFEWDEADTQTDVAGMEIVLTVYGPSNLGTPQEYDFLPDNPFFNRIAHMVCLVRDDAESFTIFQSEANQAMVDAGEASPFTVDDLMEMAMDSVKYDFSTEDANGNGELDERPCGGVPPIPCREDGNNNGQIDKIYGIAVYMNRRAEREHHLNTGSGNSKILVSGNTLKGTKLEFGSAPAP